MENLLIFYDNITELEFKWITEDGWEDKEKTYFYQSRCRKSLPVYKMNNLSRKKDIKEQKVARWILLDKHNQYLGWAECHMDQRKFLISRLSVEISLEEMSFDLSQKALSRLISSILISSNADLLKLNCLSDYLNDHMLDHNWGDISQVWVPHPNFELRSDIDAVGNDLVLFSITPERWFASQRGEADKKSLHYLALKRERLEAKRKPTHPPKKPKSIMGKLFTPPKI